MTKEIRLGAGFTLLIAAISMKGSGILYNSSIILIITSFVLYGYSLYLINSLEQIKRKNFQQYCKVQKVTREKSELIDGFSFLSFIFSVLFIAISVIL